jgi:predicted ester cyclase
VFAAQRDGLVGAGNAEDAARAATAAAAVLREAGDIAGEAKAHQVVAQQHALLGGVASAQKALDLALVAAREVRDERRIRMVLAAASRAALWGPAPVIRASGQCLDIVRIARTSPGNRAVEAAALCSQAVLEAMRERFDRARTVIALSRAAYEELGLTLELHETAIHAGLVELLAGESVAAEQELRAARDGLKALGVAATAAHASALLAHALVALDRGDEAIAATVFAEQHGGDDLKTTICWLGARAEALIRRGELDDAGALARRGVALAEPTDALADKADALMTLAATFAAAGEEHRAREAAARARELYSEKGHTAGAARAARLAGEAAADPQERRDIADVASSWDRPGIDPEVVRAIGVWVGAFNERDWATARATLADEIRGTDRRQLGSDVVNRTPDEVIAMFRAITEHAPGIRCESEVLAGEVLPGAQRVAAYIATYRNEGESPMELQVGIVSAARDGLAIISDNMDPDPEKILARYAELRSELLVQGGGSGFEDEAARSEAVAGHLAYVEAFNAHDWDAVRALCDPGWTTADHRHTAWEPLAIDTFLDQMAGGAAAVPDLHMRLDRVIACSRHVTAHVQTLCGTQAETGGAVEVAMGVVSPFIDGRALFCELFEPDDPALLARFEELVGEHDGGDVYDPQGSATA